MMDGPNAIHRIRRGKPVRQNVEYAAAAASFSMAVRAAAVRSARTETLSQCCDEGKLRGTAEKASASSNSSSTAKRSDLPKDADMKEPALYADRALTHLP